MDKKSFSLSLDQVVQLNAFLGQLLSMEPEFHAVVRDGWIPRYLRRIGYPFSWAWYYELSFTQLLASMLVMTGLAPRFLSLLREGSIDPLLDFARSYDPDVTEQRPKLRQIAAVSMSLMALLQNIRSIEYYSESIDELVTKGVHGDAIALRRAVAVDPTVLGMPSVNSHISLLTVQGNHRAIKALHHAAVKGPNKQLQPNRRLRYLERIMREGQVFQAYDRESIFRFVAHDLRLYESRRGDPHKALFTLFDRWRQDVAI